MLDDADEILASGQYDREPFSASDRFWLTDAGRHALETYERDMGRLVQYDGDFATDGSCTP